MTVIVTWSTSNGAATIENDVSFGGAGNGQETSAQTIYLRHDGENPITGCKLFLSSMVERYEGEATADGDLEEMIGWGDSETEEGFGGVFLNLDAVAGFPESSWPSFESRTVEVEGKVVGAVHKTTTGDNATNGISLIENMGCSSDETIQAGAAPNVRFQVKFVFPQNEDTEGERHVKQVLSYSYTS